MIAVGALVVRLVNNYGTTLQSRSDAVSWLGVPATWQRPAVDFSPSQPPLVLTPTFVHDDLVKSIRNSYVIISRGEEGCLGLLISNGMVMYPEHVVPIGSKGKLKYGSVEVDLCPTEVNAASVNDRQALVVRVSGLPAVKGAGHCFPMVDDVTTTTFDEVELVYPDKLAKPDRNWVMATSKGRSLATSHVTVGGDCGVVYLGRIGTTWYARAMHYGLTELLNVNYSMGEMLT